MTLELEQWAVERDLAIAKAVENAGEVWKPVPGYNGVYLVSNQGRVKSAQRVVMYRTGKTQPVSERIMTAGLDRKGYPRLILHKDGKILSWAVHRLVMFTFVPRDDWKSMHVNHKDGIRHNNIIENLEWCTNSENRLHSYRVLKTRHPMVGKCRELHHNRHPVSGRSLETGEIREYPSVSSVVDDGFKPSDVSACANGNQHTHKNWQWKHGTADVWRTA